ncbi:hypothetical protein ACU635_59750 [[Actinomadura] parvosata]|uniref:hypothetical protein n=1 Tax=[Actinomadura] parvosata TaxID=1955412 RepID=UPI00406BE337
MTNYTEDDLRSVFAEHGTREQGLSAPLDDIRRRGEARRRRRRTLAGAVLVGAAVTAAVVGSVPSRLLYAGAPAGSSARIATVPDLPESVTGYDDEPLSLIHIEGHRSWGRAVKVEFQPTSVNTGITIRCTDPRMWVLERSAEGKAGWSGFGRCAQRHESGGLDSQHDGQSIEPGWLERPQGIEIWMFPADAPIAGGAGGAGNGCTVADRRVGKCDGPWDHEAVATMPERLAAELGGPGEGPSWVVGVYDKAPGQD